MVDENKEIFNIKLDRGEVETEISDIEQNEDFNLFLKVTKGSNLYEKRIKLLDILTPKKE